MDTNSEIPSNKKIRYWRFISGTLQARALEKEICEKFTEMIFEYFEGEPLFDPQVFCPLLYHFINKCKSYESVIRRLNDLIEFLRFSRIPDGLDHFLDSNVLTFKIPSVDLNSLDKPIEEKLKKYLITDEPIWKKARVRIIPPNLSGNAAYYTHADIEFSLPHISIEQKLDILHFTICALNYLSHKDDLIEEFRNSGRSSENVKSKQKALIIISDLVNDVRRTIINKVVSDDENSQDISRLQKTQDEDFRIEKIWANKNSSLFSQTEVEVLNEEKNDSTKKKKTGTYPPYYRKRIIDAAVRLSEKRDKWTEFDLIEELDICKSTLYRQKKYFGLNKNVIRDEVKKIIREKENSQK